LVKIGFSFDWSREVTSNPDYTSTHNGFLSNYSILGTIKTAIKRRIFQLTCLKKEGNATVNAVCDENMILFYCRRMERFRKDTQEKILCNTD
jgi:leucyl-tRNA synthetase